MNKLARIVVGLGFGDEGKGTMVDLLCRQCGADLVVRYNGGSNAGHNVVTDDGRHHTFVQIGSGAFVPGVRTLLSRFTLFDPVALSYEAALLSLLRKCNVLDTHFIDYRAPIITPFHIAANRLKEWKRGGSRHGSCGKGVGETKFDMLYHTDEVIHAYDMRDVGTLSKLLVKIRHRKRMELKELGINLLQVPQHLVASADVFLDKGHVEYIAGVYEGMSNEYNIIGWKESAEMIRGSNPVFEGAQGILLDERHGFHPHTTWTNITADNALQLLRESRFQGETEIIGVARSYMTRHGAGPFVTERKDLRNIYPGEHNKLDDWQGNFRAGYQDGIMLRYAAECMRGHGGLDSIALTHLDVFDRRQVPFVSEYVFTAPCGENTLERQGGNESNDVPVIKLVPDFTGNPRRRDALTRIVKKARPIISGVLRTSDEAISYVQEVVGVPVKYRSFGPRTSDKKIVL